jgi:hypothetical protein
MAIEDRDIRIENYLLDRMSEADRVAFEAEMAEDADLQSDVTEQQQILEGIRLAGKEDLKAFLVDTDQKHFSKKGTAKQLWLKIVAAVLILLIPSYFIFQYLNTDETPTQAKVDISTYTNAYPNYFIPITRGAATPIQKDSLAMYHYENGNYELVIELIPNPESIPLRFYVGMSHLLLKQFDLAEPHFKAVLQDKDFGSAALWYQTLVLLHNNQKDPTAISNLRTIADNGKSEFRKDAKQLLQKLN